MNFDVLPEGFAVDIILDSLYSLKLYEVADHTLILFWLVFVDVTGF